MSYEVHNFQIGDVIYAADFNEMDDQIASNEANSVRYDTAQSKTDAEKSTARKNIGSAGQDSIADAFSTSKAYAVGDYVFYDAVLYKFKTTHPAGPWNSAHVDEAVIGDATSSISEKVEEHSELFINAIAPAYDSTSAYTVGEYCIHNATLYRCIADIETAEAWTAAHWEPASIAEVFEILPKDTTGMELLVSEAAQTSYFSAFFEIMKYLFDLIPKDDVGAQIKDDLHMKNILLGLLYGELQRRMEE